MHEIEPHEMKNAADKYKGLNEFWMEELGRQVGAWGVYGVGPADVTGQKPGNDLNPPVDYLKIFSGMSASELAARYPEKPKQICLLPEDLARFGKTGRWEREESLFDKDIEAGELTDQINSAQQALADHRNLSETWTSVGYGKFMRTTVRDHSDALTHRSITEHYFPDNFNVKVPDTNRFVPVRKITLDNSFRSDIGIGMPTETIIIDVADRKPASITYKHYFTREEGVRKALQLVDEFRR